MNTTDNYQLNQWEGTDRILRTDFNKDNLKTDDAVAELRAELAAAVAACPIVKLMDVTVEEDTAQIDLDLRGLDLTQYISLTLYAFFKTKSKSSSLNMRCNHIDDEVYSHEGISSNILGPLSSYGENPSFAVVELVLAPEAIFTVSHYGSWNDTTYYGGQGTPGYSIKLRPDELESLNFLYAYSSGEDLLLAGSKLWLYGRLK